MKKDEIRNGRCATCAHCKKLAEKEYRTYCCAPRRNHAGEYVIAPIEVQLHFNCHNGKYKFYEDC